MNMMGFMNMKGLQISAADGGYIIEWMERGTGPNKPGGYLENERQEMHPHFPGFGTPPLHKRAVRVKLDDALKFAGEVLKRLETQADEPEGPGSFMSAG